MKRTKKSAKKRVRKKTRKKSVKKKTVKKVKKAKPKVLKKPKELDKVMLKYYASFLQERKKKGKKFRRSKSSPKNV